MHLTLRLTKVESEMLRELQRRDARYKKGLENKIHVDIGVDYRKLTQ